MRQDPFGSRHGQQAPARRGINPRFLILLLFAGYALYYWSSNRVVDPYTGEKVLIDGSIGIEEEKALGLQAYREILQQERPLDPNAQISQQVREIARRLIAKVPEVS